MTLGRSDTYRLPPIFERSSGGWWKWLIGLAFLTGCCFWSGLIYSVPFVPAILSNRLDEVYGKAELVIPAQQRPGSVRMSPDGQRFVMLRQENGQPQWFIWDLTTDQAILIPRAISELRWINNHFLVTLGCCDDYHVIDARDGTIINAAKEANDPRQQLTNFDQLYQEWQRAGSIYVMHVFQMSGYTVLTFDGHTAKIYRAIGRTDAEAAALIARVPHIDIPKYARPIPTLTGDRIPSPDGRWYMTREEYDSTERVAIYTTDSTLVASAWKGGWEPYILGWAHDGSGVYFQLSISGQAAHILVPYAPVFKLSPFMPEEQRWHTITTAAWWVVGLAAAGGAAWWRVRRNTAWRKGRNDGSGGSGKANITIEPLKLLDT